MDWQNSDFREFPKYFGDVEPAKFSQYNVGTTASAKYIAFGYGDENSVGFVPTDFQTGISERAAQGRRAEYGSKVYTTDKMGKCIVLSDDKDNAPTLNNLKFNPFNDYELVTVHNTGVLNLWELPQSYKDISDINEPKLSICELSATATCLAFHPSIENVIAVGGNNAIFVCDLKEGKIVYKLEGLNAAIAGLEWMPNGSLIRAVTKDSKLLSFDPRSDPQAADVVVGDVKCMPENVFHLSRINSDGNIVLVTGMTGFREPVVQIFDVTNMEKSIQKIDFHFKNCFTLGYYDAICNLFYISFRTTSDLLVYNVEKSGNLTKQMIYHGVKDTFLGFDLLPKHAIKKRDINKVIKLAKTRVQLLPHVKGGKIIYEKLTTKNGPLPIGSSNDYFEKKVEDKELDLSNIAELVDPEFEEKEQRKVSLFIHVTANEKLNIQDRYFNIVTSSTVNMPLGQNIKINDKYCVYPARVTGGGALGIIQHDPKCVGRQKQAEIRAHKDSISCFDVARGIYNDTLVATGSSDAKVYVFKVPDNIFGNDNKNPNYCNENIKMEQLFEFQHDGKITFVGFHPRIPNLLITSDKSINSFKLRLWDLKDGKELIENGWELAQGCIMDVVFEPCFGLLAAVSSQDKMIRIIDIKNKKILKTFESLESMRDVKLTWIKDNTIDNIEYYTRLMTLGFGKGSLRRFSVWDLEDIVTNYYNGNNSDNNNNDEDSKDNDNDNDDEKEDSVDIDMQPLMQQVFQVSNSIPISNYDSDTNLVYVSSVGDLKLRVYELNHKLNQITEMNQPYNSKEEILGFGWKLKQDCDSAKVRMAHSFKLSKTQISTVTFHIPRRRYQEYFQDDLYIPTLDYKTPSVSFENFIEWYNDNNNNSMPKDMKSNYIDLKPKDMPIISEAPPEEETDYQKRRNSQLKKLEQDKLKQQPQSTEQAMEAFSRMVADAPTANRWDAVNIGTEVDDDEWSD